MKNTNHQFGSLVLFDSERRGTEKNLKYSWVASANADYPNVVFLHKHPLWHELGDKRLIRKLTQIFSHEVIHNILWHIMDVHGMDSHDRAILTFKKKIIKDCPRTYREYTGVF